jgi:hypothetical protein
MSDACDGQQQQQQQQQAVVADVVETFTYIISVFNIQYLSSLRLM